LFIYKMETMKKEELRKVEFKDPQHADGNYGKKGTNEKPLRPQGLFHVWEKTVSEEGDEHVKGLIERETGEMVLVSATSIKFLS
jgi:hypothetical protein